MKPVRTVIFSVLVLADLSLALLLPFTFPSQSAPVPPIKITAPAHSLGIKPTMPPAEVDCDGDEVRSPWCEARYTNVI